MLTFTQPNSVIYICAIFEDVNASKVGVEMEINTHNSKFFLSFYWPVYGSN